MTDSPLAQATNLITSMLLTVAAAVLAVAAISYLVARHFGGTSKQKRKVIFHVISGIGFLGIMGFIYLQATGRA